MTTLDLPNIQGFVVRGYRLPLAGYLFLKVVERKAASRWVADSADQVINAAPWAEKPASGINVAFTYPGLAALGIPEWSLTQFPAEFREGMAARAKFNGDVGESGPDRWERPWGPAGEVHVLVMISAEDEAALTAHKARVCAEVEANDGLTEVGWQVGAALLDEQGKYGKEHFGYRDGIGQPWIEGSPAEAWPGRGAVDGHGGWRPNRAGEFILGYLDEEDVLPTAAAPYQLTTNGSFMVYRKLSQDVAGFRRQLREAAANYPGSEELLGAKLVGRWKDGTPLKLSPAHADEALAEDDDRNNAFAYGDEKEDERGFACPVGSHIRRANPRDSLPFEGKLVNRHRIVRRGIPYGPPLAEGAEENGDADRGLIFTSLQASIERQFEFVQSQWLNDGNPLGLGDDQDVLTGRQDTEGPQKMVVQDHRPFLVGGLRNLITCRGGDYFFTPGVNGLHYIAAAEG